MNIINELSTINAFRMLSFESILKAFGLKALRQHFESTPKALQSLKAPLRVNSLCVKYNALSFFQETLKA
jgi:hypothetical protein